jgi:hypothetical protein
MSGKNGERINIKVNSAKVEDIILPTCLKEKKAANPSRIAAFLFSF